MNVDVRPYRPVLDAEVIEQLRARLDRVRLPAATSTDWRYGVPVDFLAELISDWRRFDVDELQDRLDATTHVRADVDGQLVHAVLAPGAQPDAPPLLLTHGWPGSFLEYSLVLPLLTDAFTVVVPSLPGFGFSGPPRAGALPARSVASVWQRLMTHGLGHARYVAHGSDLGAGVTAWLAREHQQSVAGIHLATPGLLPAPDPRTPEERAYAAEVRRWTGEEGGYAHEHATKPATVGAALHDSPSGLAAWIGEKVTAWSSTRPDGASTFDRGLLLATLTLYWTTGTITSSLMPYWASQHVADAALPLDDPSPVPTAVSIFGGERVPFAKPPRSLCERYYNVTAWAEHDRGGHFPAVAEPALLARTLRERLLPQT